MFNIPEKRNVSLKEVKKLKLKGLWRFSACYNILLLQTSIREFEVMFCMNKYWGFFLIDIFAVYD